MKQQIIDKLNNIEDEHDVKIILAVESGSRAWGFPSVDSDYDVRFIYLRNCDDYLTVFEPRDVIEIPVDEVFDINGWDIKKALQLLYKSNPTLIEWLNSPIVYKVADDLLAPLKGLSVRAILPETTCRHYLSMASGHVSKFGLKDMVRIKTYLYSLRPTLCCRWVIDRQTQPPMLYNDLLDEYLPDGPVRMEVDRLLKIKSDSNESDITQRSDIIENYLKEVLPQLEEAIPKKQKRLDYAEFNDTFRDILQLGS